MANNITVKDGAGVDKVIATQDIASVHHQKTIPVDIAGVPIDEGTKLGATNETPPSTDTGASGINGRLQRIAQRLSALFPGALGANGGLKIEGIASGVPVPVALISASIAAAVLVFKDALSNTVFVVDAGPKTLDSYYIFNPNAGTAYVQFFDTVGTVTLGTTVPNASLGIPGGAAANLSDVNWGFAAGMKVAATTTAKGSTAPSVGLDCVFGKV